ncbi:MAG: hypothetical protein KatS3mg089_0936 [Patescibacteria group bacterium]|nr:MAG: hypothetical protein KatS3mg089_0936 [Patescibacteria group bacterium]
MLNHLYLYSVFTNSICYLWKKIILSNIRKRVIFIVVFIFITLIINNISFTVFGEI